MPEEPLTLNCYCPGDSSVTQCTVATLTFIVQGWTSAEYAVVTLDGGPETISFNITNAERDVGLAPVPDWLDAWDSLFVFMTLGSTLHFGECDDVAAAGDDPEIFGNAGCSVSIKVVWTCVDLGTGDTSTKTEIRTASGGGGELTCLGPCGDPPQTIIYKTTYAGGSSVGGGTSFSRSLTDTCEFFDSPPVSDFGTNPRDEEKFEVNRADRDFCLCAGGGVPPYRYRIKSGLLPCGQALNWETGCITGTPDGTCHGTTVVFEVIDSAGNTAEATCDFVPDCDGLDQIGNYAF